MWQVQRVRCWCSTTCSGRVLTPSTCWPRWCLLLVPPCRYASWAPIATQRCTRTSRWPTCGPTRRRLGVAGVVGRRVPWALLVAASGQDEDDVLAGLEAAGQARLLLEAEGGAYAFAHDVIREVVEAGVGVARRAVLHRRVAT